ncbi:MAG: substrate-binding domain-containing protein [Pseudomonadota bacterium]
MKNLKISAAVSAALMMSSGAFALNQADTAAAPVQLVVAGSSAGRDTFQAEFAANCQAGTVNLYRALPTANQDFRAYSCTLLNAAPVPVAIRNTNATVYYRSEGGSGWGPGSIAKGQQIKRLLVDGTCTLVASPGFGDCAATGYSLATDGGSGHLIAATTDLGFSDEEPGMYRGENWVGLALTTEPAPGVLESLARSTGFAQTFGVLVNSALPINSISAQDVASIYQGGYSDWSQVQDQATGNALPALPITVCRRENGSGTQVSAAIHFLNQNCGVSSEGFVTQPAGPNGNTVVENGTTSSLETCTSGTAGAIGPNIFKTPAPAGTKYLSINGVAPSKVNAARGTYAYWYETSFSKRPGLAGNANSLADFLIARARAVAGIPGTSASAFAVPGVSGNAPVLPVAAAGTPVGIGTKGGNSCKTALGQL